MQDLRQPLPQRLAPALVATLLLALPGCGEEFQTPAELSSEPAPPIEAAVTTLFFRQISAGTAHTCGVTTLNKAYCWGANVIGQLGDGTRVDRSTPTPVAGGLKFLRVSAGDDHTCGITTSNRAYCWGGNFTGEIGDGQPDVLFRLRPVAVAGTRSWRHVSAGHDHTCGVTTADIPFCWGSNTEGQGGSDGFFHAAPARVLGGVLFRQIIAGAYHTCGASTSSKGYCWGANGNGQLGDGTRIRRNRPKAIAGGLSFRMVVAGSGLILIPSEQQEQGYSCGITTTDHAYCWGDGSTGVLGAGTRNTASGTPVAVLGGHKFRGINLGNFHVCAVTTTDKVYCWGGNSHGQIGDGNTAFTRWSPVPVFGDFPFKSVTANAYAHHSCAITTSGKAYCWGANGNGQLGDGTTVDKYLPVPVAGAM